MKVSPWSIVALGAGFLFGFAVLGVSLFRLQCREAATYKEDQEKQTTRLVRVPGRRGRIFDRHGIVLAECRPSHGIQCHVEEFQRRGGGTNAVAAIEAAADRLARLLGSPRTVTAEQIARHLRSASAMPLTMWTELDDGAFARFSEHADEFPGFSDFTHPERIYPFGSLAAHILGYTGHGRPDNADTAHYFESDIFGRDGVESYFNSYLTGVTGEKKITVDARGFRLTKQRGELLDSEGSETAVEPSDGLDLRLTLDKEIQSVLEEQLVGVTGAGVVIDPRDGAVLAMASAPTFDPNTCVPRLTAAVYATLTNAPAKRAQNRAVSESYAPGSTFKPITALAALSNGWLADDEYDCRGVYVLGDLRLHCWDRYGHGHLAVREALEKSCNSFFCNLGTAAGSNVIISAARAFGLGARTGIELGGETAGIVPDDGWKRATFNEPWFPGDTCQMSIGQGMLLVTPLQMAVVTAALANGGKIYRPYLHAREPGQPAPRPVRRIPFPAADIELVRQGMRDVAEKGTGRRILTRWEDRDRRRRYNVSVTCAGKTGTAELGRGATKRKNTWVIAFAPYESPTVAMAMIVERGESGGSTVAPRIHAVFTKIFGETEVTAGTRPASSSLERGD